MTKGIGFLFSLNGHSIHKKMLATIESDSRGKVNVMLNRWVKRMKSIPLFCLLWAFCISCTNASGIGHHGTPSDHFDGSRFFMEDNDHGFIDMVKWIWEMETVEWPEWIEDPEQPPPPLTVGHGQLRVTYINHATVLLQMDGINILTDPIWSLRAGPFSWLGAKRIRNPGIPFDRLPKIDLVLISHDHYDHLDIPTLKIIDERDQPMVVCGLGLESYLKKKGILRVHELDWWQSIPVKDHTLTVTFVPAKHSSGRWPFMANKTLWGGYVISSDEGHIYFAGDSGYGEFIEQIANRYERFRLTILPMGNYEKRWFMKNQHMNPEDAVKAHLVLNSSQSMGIHYATFAEHPEQTVDAHETDLSNALLKHKVNPSRFWILGFGENRVVEKRYPLKKTPGSFQRIDA